MNRIQTPPSLPDVFHFDSDGLDTVSLGLVVLTTIDPSGDRPNREATRWVKRRADTAGLCGG